MFRLGLIVLCALGIGGGRLPSAHAAQMCQTPDGFALSGKGIGGTGNPADNGIGGTGLIKDNGIGGTGRRGDIGVYGRITGFGSICVNGLEIEYGQNTPVDGGTASTDDLQVGQIVAVHAYRDGKEYRAERITIEHAVTGPVKDIDRDRGMITVQRQKILTGAGTKDVLTTLEKGDNVAVGGLRRADGIIVAAYVEKLSGVTGTQIKPASSFGPEVRYFAVQGYVTAAKDGGSVTLADGRTIFIAKAAGDKPAPNDRVLAFGQTDSQGRLIADLIVTEHEIFHPVIITPVKMPQPETVPGPDNAPEVPPADVPPIDAPPINLPVPPPVDLPPVDIPAPPPVELPPVEIPVVPPVDLPVLLPDLPPAP